MTSKKMKIDHGKNFTKKFKTELRKEKGKTEGGSTSNYYPLIPTPTPT